MDKNIREQIRSEWHTPFERIELKTMRAHDLTGMVTSSELREHEKAEKPLDTAVQVI